MNLFRKIRKHKWISKLQEEDGANQILVLLIIMLSLLVIPVILDFAIVQVSRRTAQTGSDSAVQAASKDYARSLSTTFTGFCYEPEISVVGRYKATQVIPIGYSPLGAGSAMTYSSVNDSILRSYYNQLTYRGAKTVDGVAIPNVEIYVSTEKTIRNLVNYGRIFKAPAEATSVTYLDRWDHFTFPCGTNGIFHQYIFYWKINLFN